MNAPPGGALAGYRVLELAEPAGQYCGKLLADLGADVIKIEPIGGDRGRLLGPFARERSGPETSLFFAYYNTNKRSMVLNVQQREGQEVWHRLLATADAVVETPDSSQARALDLMFETIQSANPRIVLTSLSAFGDDGPYARYVATSTTVFAKSGLMQTIGPAEGPPVPAPGQMAFDLAAVDAATGTVAALLARRRTGRGQHVRVAALEVLAAQSPLLPGEPIPTRTGHVQPATAPSGTYECRDGAVELAVVLPAQWQALKELLGWPAQLGDSIWDDRIYRRDHADRLAGIISEALRGRSQHEVVTEARQLRVPCLPVNSVADFTADEHVHARGFFVPSDRPHIGPVMMPGAPYRFGEGQWALRRPAPLLGQHTRDILIDDLGYSPDEVQELKTRGVVVCAPGA